MAAMGGESDDKCNNNVINPDTRLSGIRHHNLQNSAVQRSDGIRHHNLQNSAVQRNDDDRAPLLGRNPRRRRTRNIRNCVLLSVAVLAVATAIGVPLYIRGKKHHVEPEDPDPCFLGMKNHHVADDSIASSSRFSAFTDDKWARLYQKPIPGSSNGSWCADPGDANKWIQIDFRRMEEIAGVVTQGSPSANLWTTSYSVSCGDSEAKFVDLKEFTPNSAKIFRANSDRDTVAVNFFHHTINCQYLRIYPKTWKGTACMRLDILRGNCSWPNNYGFYAESAGRNDGNFCKLMVNGIDNAHHEQGHNVLIFDPDTTKINVSSFDTYHADAQADCMAEFIDGAPSYSIISIAVMGSGRKMTSHADSALRSLGAGGAGCPTHIKNRDSWAFISQKILPDDPFPSWFACSYLPSGKGRAMVSAQLTISAHYDSMDDSPLVH